MLFKAIKNLFNKTEHAATDIKTAPLSEEQLKTVTKPIIAAKPLQITVGCGQSVGKQRDHNEDALFSMSTTISYGEVETAFGFFAIADGMGGHQFGEIASGSAIRAISNHVITKIFSPLLGYKSEEQFESLQEIVESGFNLAQKAVLDYAPGGGTTLTTALVIGDQVTISHVGDSRIYFIYPDGRMEIMTHDHSYVRRLLDLGQITEEEAKNHPNKNVLYRALGQNEPFRPDIRTTPFPTPGYLLICSDGLWGVISEGEIFKIVTNAANPVNACQELVDLANLAGGPDNISVVLVQNC